jgi:hypothetical protein
MQQVYRPFEKLDTAVDLGRREIAYGDHRFVGDVNWRQNHQAFDAVHLANRSFAKTTLSYTFADKVIRVNGGEKEMSSHFLNAVVALDPAISLELSSYLLDYEEEADATLSSQSYGGKLSGGLPFREKHRLLYEAQYAKQAAFGKNPADRDADYLHLVGGIGVSNKLTFKIGRELLGGSPERGSFQTPLATLFKFNGGPTDSSRHRLRVSSTGTGAAKEGSAPSAGCWPIMTSAQTRERTTVGRSSTPDSPTLLPGNSRSVFRWLSSAWLTSPPIPAKRGYGRNTVSDTSRG